MNIAILFNSHYSQCGSALPQDHEYGLHADGSKSNMGTREADRYQQIGAFSLGGQQGPHINLVRIFRMHADIALILDKAIRFDIALNIMGIHGIRAHSHRLFHRRFPQYLILSHNKITHHPACFTHINLVGPMPVVAKLIPGISPMAHLFPEIFRNSWIADKEPEQSFLIRGMLFDDLRSCLVICLRIVIVHADIVGTKGSMVIYIGLIIGYGIEFIEHFSPT